MGFTRNIDGRATLGPLLNRLGLPSTVLSLLLAHADAVRAANQRLGLVSPADVDQIVRRHTADSLLFALARTPAPGESWLDVGSGAGFPGLVLACCFPDCIFTLLEPHGRRAGFLELTASDLGLANVSIAGHRLEDGFDSPFDVAVARALRDPDAAMNALVDAVRPGGEAIVAIGRDVVVATPARRVTVELSDNVDSPGVFSMMTREV